MIIIIIVNNNNNNNYNNNNKHTQKIVCRKMQREKNCLHRQQQKKIVCLEKIFIPRPSKKIMVRPLARFFLMFRSRVIIKGQFSLPFALDKTEGPR